MALVIKINFYFTATQGIAGRRMNYNFPLITVGGDNGISMKIVRMSADDDIEGRRCSSQFDIVSSVTIFITKLGKTYNYLTVFFFFK